MASTSDSEETWRAEDVAWDPYTCKAIRKKPAEPRPRRCQVEGCSANLTGENNYLRLASVCEAHFKATSVTISGNPYRFCAQCAYAALAGAGREG